MLFQTSPAKYRGQLEHVYPSNHPTNSNKEMYAISTKAHTQNTEKAATAPTAKLLSTESEDQKQ